MILFDAVSGEFFKQAIKAKRHILVSFFYKNCLKLELMAEMKSKGLQLFMDSGAFSAENIGAKINLKEYIQFLQKNNSFITQYAGLDDISDYKRTMINQKIMESEGLKPLITFHYGEPIELLRDYLLSYDYICIGGVVGKSRKLKLAWLSMLYSKVVKEFPEKKIHMFGVHDKELLLRFPFYSADASSSVKFAIYGGSAFGKSTKPVKSLEFMRHLQLQSNLERYYSLALSRKEVETYVTNVWRKRGITW